MTDFTDILTNPTVRELLKNLVTGDINLMTGLVWLGIATALSIVGGAIGGVLLASKDLGYQLAAMIGGLFGPAGVIPAVMLGLVVLKLL